MLVFIMIIFMITYILLLGTCFAMEPDNSSENSDKENTVSIHSTKPTERLKEHWDRVCKESKGWLEKAKKDIDLENKGKAWGKDNRKKLEHKRDVRNGQIDYVEGICENGKLKINIATAIENKKIDEVAGSFEPFYLYHGMYTASANNRDLTKYIRKALGDSLPDTFIKIFLKDKSKDNKWGGQDTFKDVQDVFKNLQKEQEEQKSHGLDFYPVSGSLISFSSNIKDTSIGESALYFLAKEKKANGKIDGGLNTVIKPSFTAVINGLEIEKDWTNAGKIVEKLWHDMSDLNEIDNGKVLQFAFPEHEIEQWKDLGLWTMSYGSTVVKDENTAKNLEDLYHAVQKLKDGPSENQCENLFKNHDNPESDSDNKSTDTSSEKSNKKYQRKHSINLSEKRCLWEEVNGKPAPMTYRLQARLPMNVKAVQDWMEKHPPVEKSLSFAEKKDQKRLQEGLKIIAKRFLAFISGQIEFQNNKWLMTGKTNSDQWKKLQDIYPYFKGKEIPMFNAKDLKAESVKTEKSKNEVQEEKTWNSSTKLSDEQKYGADKKDGLYSRSQSSF